MKNRFSKALSKGLPIRPKAIGVVFNKSSKKKLDASPLIRIRHRHLIDTVRIPKTTYQVGTDEIGYGTLIMKKSCYLGWVADGVEVSGEGLQVSDHLQALLTPPPASHQPVTYWIRHFFIIRNMTVFGTMCFGFAMVSERIRIIIYHVTAVRTLVQISQSLCFQTWKLKIF